jgi:hypothetical protein
MGGWPNADAEIAREVMGYLRAQHSYGLRVTGRSLEEKFGGLGYGWQRDVLQLVLAVLLRAGAIEVSSQGRRFRSHVDPQCRQVFTNQPAFRAASFVPREGIDLRTLTGAVRTFEELTGEELEAEESAIAAASKRLASQELEALHPIQAALTSNSLPGLETLQEYRSTLQELRDGESDDVVRALAGEGRTLKELRERVRRLAEVTTGPGLQRVRQARTALQQWPVVASRGDGHDLAATADDLREKLESPTFYEAETAAAIAEAARVIQQAYRDIYARLHEQRSEAFREASEAVKGRAEWALLQPPNPDEQDAYRELRDSVLRELDRRACLDDDGASRLALADGAVACANCAASVSQIESDLVAVPGLRSQAIVQLQKATAPTEDQVVVVRLADYFARTLDTEESVNEAVERLRDDLLALLADGKQLVVE